MKCGICKNNYKTSECEPRCNRMCEDFSDFEPITNADMIRRMTDEELANFLYITIYESGDNLFPCIDNNDFERSHCHCNDCIGCYLNWLKSDAEVK